MFSSAPIALNLQHVQHRIAQAAARAQRPVESIRLLAVSKFFDAEAVAAAADAGQHAFGENYVQEGVAKIEALRARELEWHCIGPLQSRKTALVATHFDWLQSLDRPELAERLNRQRPETCAPLQVCLQVNMDGGATKHGVAPDAVLALARTVMVLPRLELRGLMSIPDPSDDPQQTLAVHRDTRALFDDVGRQLGLPRWDTLSMGMSADLEEAVEAGSTMVRIGTAIFGARPVKTQVPEGAA